MSEILILSLTFFSVLILSSVIIGALNNRAEVARRLRTEETIEIADNLPIPKEIRGIPVSDAELIKHYYNVIRSDQNPNSLANRLIRAGYFSPQAAAVFQVLRIAIAAAVFFAIYLFVLRVLPEIPISQIIILGLFGAGIGFFLCGIVLERIGDKREVQYRKLFPDFMDTLVCCLDAGLSVEGAVDRVTREFLNSSNKDFGLHLAIMTLEVRGGRRLRDALSNFAKRLRIDEAQSLAVLFRQSEELGASVTRTLRVFGNEMRDKRMVRAEEKANALPFKMLFPLALFLFPVSVLIVGLPIIMRVISMFKSMAPS